MIERAKSPHAAEHVWVCEKGHVDDHHYDNEPQLCSRCGGKCERFSLDRLAREYVERLRVNVGLVAENSALKRQKGTGSGAGTEAPVTRDAPGPKAEALSTPGPDAPADSIAAIPVDEAASEGSGAASKCLTCSGKRRILHAGTGAPTRLIPCPDCSPGTSGDDEGGEG